MKVSAGLRGIVVSEETTAVGAEARVVESGMVGLLRRVKAWSPRS
jgi:hypothetical protein